MQVKTGRYKNGCVIFDTCSAKRSKYGDKKWERQNYNNDVEYFGVYCSETNKGYIIPINKIKKSVMGLRIEPPKNNQRSKIVWAIDYEFKVQMNNLCKSHGGW